jgi:tetratricopeptide (TPR) repeat protein
VENKYLTQACRFYDSGDYEAALAVLNDLLSVEPENAAAFFQRALVRDALEDHDGVLADYTQSMKLDRYDAGSAKNRGLEFMRRGEYEKALADFENALHRHQQWSLSTGNLPDAHSLAEFLMDKSHALENLGRRDEAVADATEALECDPGSIDACQFLAYNSPGFTREHWLVRVETELKKSPGDDRLHFMQSLLFNWAGKIEPGLIALERAIAIAPYDRDYRIEAIGRLLELKRWPELEAQCSRVIGLLGNDPAFNSARAYALAHLEKHGPMLEDVALTIKLAPNASGEHYDCACTLGVAFKSNPAAVGVRRKCLELLRRAIELGFDDLDWIRNDEDFALLRNDPEFQELISRVASKNKA